MAYSEEQIAHIQEEYLTVKQGLLELIEKTVLMGQSSECVAVKEHLLHGAARRLSILRKCLENIFNSFPPTTVRPLQRDVIYDVQINLHAYFVNLYGIFDNWAWSFVLRHDLLEDVGGKRKVGLFLKSTNKHLAKTLRDYLTSDTTTNWHEKYLKHYRDALAHRIPLYIPLADFTKADDKRYKQLDGEKINLIKAKNWQKLEDLYKEQESIGRPSFVFMHSYEEGVGKPVFLHPQLLCDGLTIIEFGTLFIEHWEEVAEIGV
jgi:hypothetical protein